MMSDVHGYYLEDMSVGMTAVYTRTVTEADIVLFCGISGDANPVHLDQEFAKSQGGLFTHDAEAVKDFVEGSEVPTLSHLIEGSTLFKVMMRPTTGSSIRQKPFRLRFRRRLGPLLLQMLRVRRVTLAHLMPTLSNVASVVRGGPDEG